MAITTYDVAQKKQWDALLAAISSEAQPGKRLAGINYVGRAFTIWAENAPAIGVQMQGTTIEPRATLQRTMTSTYGIVVACQSTDTTASINMGPNTPGNVEDAMNQVQAFVADGNGNGLLAVLSDPANYMLGGYAYKITPGSVAFDWEVKPGQPPQMWAYAVLTVTALQIIQIQ